MPEEFFFYFHL